MKIFQKHENISYLLAERRVRLEASAVRLEVKYRASGAEVRIDVPEG